MMVAQMKTLCFVDIQTSWHIERESLQRTTTNIRVYYLSAVQSVWRCVFMHVCICVCVCPTRCTMCAIFNKHSNCFTIQIKYTSTIILLRNKYAYIYIHVSSSRRRRLYFTAPPNANEFICIYMYIVYVCMYVCIHMLPDPFSHFLCYIFIRFSDRQNKLIF